MKKFFANTLRGRHGFVTVTAQIFSGSLAGNGNQHSSENELHGEATLDFIIQQLRSLHAMDRRNPVQISHATRTVAN